MNDHTKYDSSVRKQDISDKSSVIILIGLVVLSLLANTLFKDRVPVEQGVSEIRFPAYETEYEEINKAMPFNLKITLPEGWEVKAEGDVSAFPDVNLHNPYFIYSGENCIGYMGFNVFTPPAEENDAVSYHQSVWPVMDKGNLLINNYATVRLTDKFEAAYCNIEAWDKTADAILCYNRDVGNMVGIILEKGIADESVLQQICLSLSFSIM